MYRHLRKFTELVRCKWLTGVELWSGECGGWEVKASVDILTTNAGREEES